MMRSLFRRVLWHHFAIAVIAIVAAAVVVFVHVAYTNRWEWTGFVETVQVPVAPVQTTLWERKTLWDWLELLIVPVFLGVAAWGVNLGRRRTELAREREHAQDTILQDFMDRISRLLLDNKLKHSARDSPVRTIAAMHTIDVLRRLEEKRRNTAILFLAQADLLGGTLTASYEEITSSTPCLRESVGLLSRVVMDRISLDDTDLSGVDLGHTTLSRSTLRRAGLSYAKMRGGNMSEVDMRGADLKCADLSVSSLVFSRLDGAILVSADLRWALLAYAVMRGADCTGADFREAILDGTNLRKAILDGADLMGADLRRAKGLSCGQLRKAKNWHIAHRGKALSCGAPIPEPPSDGVAFRHLERKFKEMMPGENVYRRGMWPGNH